MKAFQLFRDTDHKREAFARALRNRIAGCWEALRITSPEAVFDPTPTPLGNALLRRLESAPGGTTDAAALANARRAFRDAEDMAEIRGIQTIGDAFKYAGEMMEPGGVTGQSLWHEEKQKRADRDAAEAERVNLLFAFCIVSAFALFSSVLCIVATAQRNDARRDYRNAVLQLETERARDAGARQYYGTAALRPFAVGTGWAELKPEPLPVLQQARSGKRRK